MISFKHVFNKQKALWNAAFPAPHLHTAAFHKVRQVSHTEAVDASKVMVPISDTFNMVENDRFSYGYLYDLPMVYLWFAYGYLWCTYNLHNLLT